MAYYEHPDLPHPISDRASFNLDGMKYPAGWLLQMTPEGIAELGFTKHVPPAPPVRPLPDRRGDALAALAERAREARAKGVIVLGNQFSSDDGSLQQLAIALAAAEADSTMTLSLRAGRGTMVELNANQIRQVAIAVVRYQNRVLANEISLEAQIMASGAPETIDIDANWPAR